VHAGARRAAERELERQQALMLEALHAAGGRPVSYGELQEAGVEYPASVGEELELAGVALERVEMHPTSGRRRARGVRLSGAPPRGAAAEPVLERSGARRYKTGLLPPLPAWLRRRGAPWPAVSDRALVAALLLMVVAAAIALVAVAATRGSAERVVAARRLGAAVHRAAAHGSVPASTGSTSAVQQRSTQQASVQAQAVTPPASTAQTPPPAPAGGSLATQTPTQNGGAGQPSVALAVDLEARGHTLLESGQAAQAIPVLERAVAATGGSLPRCAEPEGEACLTYAYSLYDLGSALRRAGRASAAIQILALRLKIANQRATVAGELGQAQREVQKHA
jgi:hypothetical protein